jgi:hypothetical protein
LPFVYRFLQPPAFDHATEQFTAKLEAMKSTMQQLKDHETFSSLMLASPVTAERTSIDRLAVSADMSNLLVFAKDNEQTAVDKSPPGNDAKKLTNLCNVPYEVDVSESISSPENYINETDSSRDVNSNKISKIDGEEPCRFATPELPSGDTSVITSSDDDNELPSNVDDAMPNSDVKTELNLTVDETGAGDYVTLQMRSSSGWAGWPKRRDGDNADTPCDPDDELVKGNGEGCLDGELRAEAEVSHSRTLFFGVFLLRENFV